MIRILLVDDQKTIRESLRVILEAAPDLQVVGTASDGHTAIEQVSYLKPDVVLIDMEMPGLDGVSATQIISQKFTDVKVLVLSMHDDDALIAKSNRAGALGYLLKNTPPQELRAAVRFVQLGYPQYGPGLLDKVISANTEPLINGNGHGYAMPEIQEKRDSLALDPVPVAEGLGTQPLYEGRQAITSARERSLEYERTQQEPVKTPEALPAAQEALPSLRSLEDEPTPAGRWKRYLVLGVLLNTLLWAMGITYLKFKRPLYTSVWTLDLPASRSNSVLEVPGVGRAAQNNDSPYSNIMVADPRTTYKDLLEGQEVRAAAADLLKEDPDDLSRLWVEVVPNTTLIRLSVIAPTPQEARQRAVAYQDAFDGKLSALRRQEIAQRSQNLKASLDSAADRLRIAQQRLSNYKTESGLESGEQLSTLSANIEALRRQKSEVVAQMEDTRNQLRQLAGNLGVQPQQAADAFVLQSDSLFQQYLANYSKSTADLNTLTSTLEPTHPSVVDLQEENKAAREQLMARGQQLLGRPVNDTTLKQINVSGGNSTSQRSSLFQEMITLQGREQGFAGQVAALDQQIRQLEGRLTNLSGKNSVLVNLERDVQIAEAIFTSTLGKLDLTKSNSSDAYPQVTIRSKPSLPKQPSSPNVLRILGGTFFASILLSAGITTLWLRDRRWQRLRLQKNLSQTLIPDTLPPVPSLQGQSPYPSLPVRE